jgi:hypothetical protein
VWVIIDQSEDSVYGPDQKVSGSFTHALITISGTATDGPISIQLYPTDVEKASDLIALVSYGQLIPSNDYRRWVLLARYGRPGAVDHTRPWMTDEPEFGPDDIKRYQSQLPSMTTLTNKELLDPTTGEGIAQLVWSENNWINLGLGKRPYDYNGPLTYVRALLEHPSFFHRGWKLEEKATRLSDLLKGGITYWHWQDSYEVRVRANAMYLYEQLPLFHTLSSHWKLDWPRKPVLLHRDEMGPDGRPLVEYKPEALAALPRAGSVRK